MDFKFHFLFKILLLLIEYSIVRGEFGPEMVCPGELSFGKLIAVRFPHCNSFPCEVFRGESYPFEIEFEAGPASEVLSTYATIDIVGVEIRWKGAPEGGSCQLLTNESCPYAEGQRLVYKTEIPIDLNLPLVYVTGHWRLHNERYQNQICISLPLEIKDRSGIPVSTESENETDITTILYSTTIINDLNDISTESCGYILSVGVSFLIFLSFLLLLI